MTTSDLVYVSGGGTCGPGTTYAYGTCYGNTSTDYSYGGSSNNQTQPEMTEAEMEGILTAVDNPLGYGVGVLVNLYNCYKSSSSFKGYSTAQIVAAIASGCTE